MTDLDQHHFDSLLPRKSFLHIKEVEKLLGLSDTTIVNLIDAGQLLCHQFNCGRGLRMTRRIPRQGLVLLLLQTKTYEIEDFLSGILGLLAKLSAAELTLIRDRLPVLIDQAPPHEPSALKSSRCHSPILRDK